jgi:hypothetical protein
MIKNPKKYIIKTALAFAIGYTALSSYIYFSTVSSEEYRVAVAYAKESKEIRTRLSEVTKTSLAPFGIQILYAGDSGRAKFSLNIEGTQGKIKVEFKLSRKSYVWKVDTITFL